MSTLSKSMSTHYQNPWHHGLVSSVSRELSSKLSGPGFKFQLGTVGGPATINNNVGCSARLKTSFELNPVSPHVCIDRAMPFQYVYEGVAEVAPLIVITHNSVASQFLVVMAHIISLDPHYSSSPATVGGPNIRDIIS